MPPAHRIGRITLFCPSLLLLSILIAIFPGAWIVHAQPLPQNPLAGKNVLVLNSHELSAPVFLQTDKGLLTTLESGGIPRTNQFFETLDLRRNPGSENRRFLVETMRARYSHRKVDLMVTMYPEALEFALKDCRDIFPAVPIVALYLPQNHELPETDRLIIRHFPRLDIVGTLEIALKLVPRAKHVYVVSGVHEVDRRVEDQSRRELKKWESRLQFHYLSHMPFEKMVATIYAMPPDSILLALVISRDVTGRDLTSIEVAQRLSQVSRCPIFGLLDVALGHGSTGGSLINFERIGTRAGELTLDILSGTKIPKNIPEFLDVPPVAMFDWRQIRRWNLNEAALPKGSMVVNREVTFWDFKYYVFGGLALMLGQAFLIGRLLINRRSRRSAEVSLRQKTEELDRFFSLSPDLLRIANTDGYSLFVNPAWERILGYSREEIMAKQFFDFVHPEDLNRTREAVSRLASQQSMIHFENRYRCKDGTYRWLEWTAAPAGNLIYASARDITERLKADAEARQHREELAHVARIATVGELTASLAHEINQPLAAIRANAEAAQRFLSQASPDVNEVRQILDDIIRDDRRASDVVGKVRALVKKERSHEESLDLNKVIGEVVSLIRGETLLQGLSIAMELSPDLEMIRGDRIQLQQVVLNLILNGADAMRNAQRDQRKIIVRTAVIGSGAVQAFVTDFGTGIDENHIERLFEPFYTTKREGLGMGLAISKGIIKAHGGTVEAYNNPEGGATFAFTLPTSKGEAP